MSWIEDVVVSVARGQEVYEEDLRERLEAGHRDNLSPSSLSADSGDHSSPRCLRHFRSENRSSSAWARSRISSWGKLVVIGTWMREVVLEFSSQSAERRLQAGDDLDRHRI